MVAQGGGAIVNLLSVTSKIGITDRFASNEQRSHYHNDYPLLKTT